ncbi:MAG: hypothetical protein ACYTBJ_24520 [Planctomycetota bacterium]|jgi:hypothetical protein
MARGKSGLYNLKSGEATLGDIDGGFRAGTMFAGTNGLDYFLDPANGNDSNDGLTPGSAFATLAVGYAALTANQHDILWYIAGSSGTNLSAAVTWAKNYTHLIGVAAPTMTAQRARFFQLSTLTGASPLLTISATGCVFSNFYIFQGVNDATSLINVSVTGGRNFFDNVHFAGGGHATQAVDGGASLLLNGAEENTFFGCTIGVDTIDAATGMMAMRMDAEAHRNVFKECIFRMRAGNSGAGFVEVVDATGIDRDNTFDNCIFINNATANDMASAFVIPAGMGEPRVLLLKDCMFLNTTKLDANDRGVLFGNMNAVTGADLSGVAVELKT